MGEIILYDQISQSQNPMELIRQMGEDWARSGMLGVETPEQGAVVAMAAVIERKSPLDIVRTYHVIEGNLCKRSSAMLAEFQQDGGRVKWVQADPEVCEAVFSHPQYQPDGVTIRLSLKELTDSGVAVGKGGKLKENYKKHSRRMLRARVVSEGVGVVHPAITSGTYTPEEVADFAKRPVDVGNLDASTPAPVATVDAAQELLQDKKPEPEPAITDAEFEMVEEKPEPEADAAYNTQIVKLDDDTKAKAISFLQAIGWLADGDHLLDLPEHHKKEVVDRWDAFIAKVQEVAA